MRSRLKVDDRVDMKFYLVLKKLQGLFKNASSVGKRNLENSNVFRSLTKVLIIGFTKAGKTRRLTFIQFLIEPILDSIRKGVTIIFFLAKVLLLPAKPPKYGGSIGFFELRK